MNELTFHMICVEGHKLLILLLQHEDSAYPSGSTFFKKMEKPLSKLENILFELVHGPYDTDAKLATIQTKSSLRDHVFSSFTFVEVFKKFLSTCKQFAEDCAYISTAVSHGRLKSLYDAVVWLHTVHEVLTTSFIDLWYRNVNVVD